MRLALAIFLFAMAIIACAEREVAVQEKELPEKPGSAVIAWSIIPGIFTLYLREDVVEYPPGVTTYVSLSDLRIHDPELLEALEPLGIRRMWKDINNSQAHNVEFTKMCHFWETIEKNLMALPVVEKAIPQSTFGVINPGGGWNDWRYPFFLPGIVLTIEPEGLQAGDCKSAVTIDGDKYDGLDEARKKMKVWDEDRLRYSQNYAQKSTDMTCRYVGAIERPGAAYIIHIARSGYVPKDVGPIEVTLDKDECHVVTRNIKVKLEPQ